MNLIIALNDNIVYLRLKEIYQDRFNTFKVDSVDSIYEMLSKEEDYIIVITENALSNIDKIKENVAKVRFVLIVKKLNEELKKEVFSKEIFNIIEGEEFLFQDLIESIENPKVVIYKNRVESLNSVVLITGTTSSGKTTLAKLLGECLAKEGDKTLVVDFNFLSPSLDIYTGNDANYSLYEIIKDTKINKYKNIKVYETNTKNHNLKYILNSKSIEIPEEDIQVKLLKYLASKYEYVIVDTSSLNINMVYRMLKKLDAKVIFVLEESIKGIREYYTITKYIEKLQLYDSLLVLSRYNKDKNLNKYIKEHIPIECCGYINKNRFIDLYIRKNVKLFRYNIKKLIRNLKNNESNKYKKKEE